MGRFDRYRSIIIIILIFDLYMSRQDYIQATNKAGFEKALKEGKISEEQIGFIEEEDLIWAKGNYYGAVPDNEDLTKDKDGKLQFSDRSYNPANFSGKGYKILRKNIVQERNVLTQEMMAEPNTIYEIRYDFDLSGETINVPEGCVLKFEGGSLKNGTLNGNGTTIYGNKVDILLNTTLIGQFSNLECDLEWWGVRTGAGIDNSLAIQHAFDSKIPIVIVSDKYYISSPVMLPYNKIIKGRTGNNNQLTGFIANDDFKSKVVHFPDRYEVPAYDKEVFGMFYHRDTTKSELHDIFIDARWKSDFCVEHIDLYGSIDFYNCYIKGAREIGVLQYACENPIINQLLIESCNIGYYQSTNEYNRNNLFDFNGKAKGSPNISNFKLLRVLACNYGVILNGGSNYYLDSPETAYNSIIGMYLRGSIYQINSYYSEVDGICNFWIDQNGKRVDSTSKEKTLQYLIDNNLDGFKPPRIDNRYEKEVYVRAPLFIHLSNVELNSSFISVHPRSSIYNNNEDVLDINNREYSGVDCYVITKESDLCGRNNHSYIYSDNTGLKCNSCIIDIYNTSYTLYKKFDIEFSDGFNNINVLPTRVFSTKLFYINDRESGYNRSCLFNLYNTVFKNLNSINLFRHDKKPIYECLNFIEYYNKIPLYQYDGKSLFLKFTKEEFIKKFNGLSQVKIFGVFKIKKEGIFRIRSQVRFNLRDKYVTGHSTNPGTDETYKQGYYKFEYIFNVNIAQEYDTVGISIGNEVISSPDLKDDILISDLYFYEVTDVKMETPQVTNLHIQKGTTSQRPTGVQPGFHYFDTDLGHDMVWDGQEWYDPTNKDEFSDLYKIMYNQHASVSVSSNVPGNIIEKGVPKAVTLSWNYIFNGASTTPDTLQLKSGQDVLVGDKGTKTYTDNIQDTKTYQVVSIMKGVTKTAGITINAYYPIYYGGSSKTTLTSDDVLAFTKHGSIKSNPSGSYNFQVDAGEYAWICVPAGMVINKVTSNGFGVPIEPLATVAVTGKGNYNCYRSSETFTSGMFSCVVG